MYLYVYRDNYNCLTVACPNWVSNWLTKSNLVVAPNASDVLFFTAYNYINDKRYEVGGDRCMHIPYIRYATRNMFICSSMLAARQLNNCL